MNIHFNSNKMNINWNNTKLANQQKLVSTLFGNKNGKSSGVLNLSLDGDVYSKGVEKTDYIYTAKGRTSGRCSAEEMVKDIERVAKNGYSWSVDGDTFTLGNTGKSCSLKELQKALNYDNPKTMEVKKYPNLFCIGEVLNIDGFCGGFNLQNAWSTANIAADTILSYK